MTASQDPPRALATLARVLQFEGSADVQRAKADGALILDAAAQVMFEDGLTVAQVIARIHGK